MKRKLIEFIRQMLIKTILPLKNKKEKCLSQFRFSIAFRTSLNYVKLLVIYGALFFVALIVIFVQVETNQYNAKAKTILTNLEEKKVEIINKEYFEGRGVKVYEYSDESDLKSYSETSDQSQIQKYRKEVYQSKINPYYNRGISMRISIDNETVYEDIIGDVSSDKRFLNKYSYHYKKSKALIVKSVKTFEVNGIKYEVYFQYDLTESVMGLGSILLWSILAYIGLVLIIMKFGKKGILKLFKPIDEMSAKAMHLNANNLSKERLHVEGTKNELKDLAIVINQMLDRIEVSYESQKQFVSDASHELRTPIAVVQGYANLLDRWGSKNPEVLEESIEAIRNEAKSMQDLVEKLLFLSRHDKKTLKLTKIKFNMKQVVEEMVRETNLVVEDRKIICPILEDVMVYGDKQALKQAMRIFIDNAVKYTKEDDEITVLCENKDGDCVVTVQDSGMGMTKEDIDHIFERFYRSNQVRNEKISGHGLGLSIAKLIILKHTGRIKVRSQYTKGSSFIITLPTNHRQGETCSNTI